MRIGNRLFPYPVLNQDVALSDYKADTVFGLEFNENPIIQNGELIFKDLYYTVTDSALNNLISQGKVKGAFIVECSASMYRKKFEIGLTPHSLTIPANEINGNVVASCYLYAVEDIHNFKSENFLDEYSEYKFDIETFDILAVDDGVKFKVESDGSQYNKVASIFVVAKMSEDIGGDLMLYENRSNHIVINLPEKFYKCYELIKMNRESNNIAFSILALPALAACLGEINDYNSLDDIIENYSWFKAVCISYKRVTGKELTIDDFKELNKLELAQKVLNFATCSGIADFERIIFSTSDGDDDYE